MQKHLSIFKKILRRNFIMEKIAMFGGKEFTEEEAKAKGFSSFEFGNLKLVANCTKEQEVQILERTSLQQYAKEMADYINNSIPMKTIIVFDGDRVLFGNENDDPEPYYGILNADGMNNAKYIDIVMDSNPFVTTILMTADYYFKTNMRNKASFIYQAVSYYVWYFNPNINIDGHTCSEELHKIICEYFEKLKNDSEEDKSEEPKPKKDKKTEEPVIDVNPEELKPDDEPEEKKIETPNAAPVVICLPMRDDTVEVKIPKTPPVKSGPEAATPDSVQLDPPKTVETKVTNVQGMTVVENTDGTHIYAPEVAYDASVMYGAEIVNSPRPSADKLIAQNRAELRRYFLQRGLIRKTKKGYMLKHVDFNKKKAETFGLTEVLNRAYALQDQLRKMNKQCEVYITPRDFLLNTAEDEAAVEVLNGYRKEKRLNFKDPNMMVPYLDSCIPNNYTVDIVCYDDAGSVFKPYCLSIDFLGCIEKYTTVNGQKVEGARIPQIFLGASLIFDGEEISNLYFGKEEENNCIIMKIPCSLKNIDSIFRQIAKGYWESIEEDFPLMKDAKAPERERELKQKAVANMNKPVAAAN